MEWLDQGEPWRTVASPGQAGVKSRKHKNQSWAKGCVWSGQGPGNRTKCLEGGCLQRKELLVWGLTPGCQDQGESNFMSLAVRLCTAKMSWGEHLPGLRVTGSIGDSRGWGRSLTRVAKENARWPFAEVTSYKIPFIDVFSMDKWQHGFCRV